jgi:hypothetical protein
VFVLPSNMDHSTLSLAIPILFDESDASAPGEHSNFQVTLHRDGPL